MLFDEYIVGGFIASLLAVAFLWSRRRENKSLPENGVTAVTTTVAVAGECRSDSDVIIVGAGVAGAALAHTLGKVVFIL